MGQKAILMAGLLTVALFACGGPFSMEETAGGEGALSGSQALQSGDGSACSMERSCAVLYIGVGNQFAEYPVEYTGELDENGQIPPEEEVFVIGGAQIYGEALPAADRFYLTRVHRAYEGDTRFPEWDAAEWRLVGSESFPCGERYEYPFTFETYERKR